MGEQEKLFPATIPLILDQRLPLAPCMCPFCLPQVRATRSSPPSPQQHLHFHTCLQSRQSPNTTTSYPQSHMKRGLLHPSSPSHHPRTNHCLSHIPPFLLPGLAPGQLSQMA